MVNETGGFPEVCKKSVQAMAADLQGAIPADVLDRTSFSTLERMTPRELEHSGRLTEPLIATSLDSTFRRVSWDEALSRAGAAMHRTDPGRSFYYFSGRSSNEAGFLLQLAARLRGTNNVNNCSYYCHQASGVGLASVTGSGTATVVLADLDRADLVVLIGANPASNHPRFMRSLVNVRRRGGKVIVINPVREPGLMRFKIPSDVRSMLRASQIADLYVQSAVGGDAMLMAGVMKRHAERGELDRSFLEAHTEGWDSWEDRLRTLEWDQIAASSGVSRAIIDAVADMCAASQATIYAWAMGLTHHVAGVQSVQILGALAASRGMIGAPGRGLLPLRGHSNVQGIGSMGVVPTLKDASFAAMQSRWGDVFPVSPGLDTMACMESAHRGEIDFAMCLGGNLFGSNPDAGFAAEAMQRIGTVVHLSTTLNTGHVRARGRETIILPVLARDEEPQSTTQESMFNYVRVSEGGRPRHEGPRSETEIIAAIAELGIGSECAVDLDELRTHAGIRRAIAAVVPGYAPIEKVDEQGVDEQGEEFQIDGRTFHSPSFATPTGRLRIHNVDIPKPAMLEDRQVRVVTVRSEGQFNTVVYEDEDVYRGGAPRHARLKSRQRPVRWWLWRGHSILLAVPRRCTSPSAMCWCLAQSIRQARLQRSKALLQHLGLLQHSRGYRFPTSRSARTSIPRTRLRSASRLGAYCSATLRSTKSVSTKCARLVVKSCMPSS